MLYNFVSGNFILFCTFLFPFYSDTVLFKFVLFVHGMVAPQILLATTLFRRGWRQNLGTCDGLCEVLREILSK